MSDTQGMTQETSENNFPLFYNKPQPLNADKHANLSLKAINNYKFAVDTNSVPLVAAEFAHAVKNYPIVFVESSPAAPVAVMGLRNAENLFINAKGEWKQGTYVPAYVQRYPFIFMEITDTDQLVLCVDESSEMVEENGENRFFENGEATDLAKRALDACSQFQAHFNFTTEFTEALKKHELLIPNQAEIVLRSGERMNLGGFQVIDEEKFRKLPDNVIIEWKDKGYLHLVYAHFMSMSNWNNLVELTAERMQTTGTQQ